MEFFKRKKKTKLFVLLTWHWGAIKRNHTVLASDATIQIF